MLSFTVQTHNVDSTVVDAPVNTTEVDVVEGSGEESHVEHTPLWFGEFVHFWQRQTENKWPQACITQ